MCLFRPTVSGVEHHPYFHVFFLRRFGFRKNTNICETVLRVTTPKPLDAVLQHCLLLRQAVGAQQKFNVAIALEKVADGFQQFVDALQRPSVVFQIQIIVEKMIVKHKRYSLSRVARHGVSTAGRVADIASDTHSCQCVIHVAQSIV